MELVVPTWFKQRQAKAEPAGADTYRLSAPNQNEAFIRIARSDKGPWLAALRLAADGPEVACTEAVFDKPQDAWEAAFELYRGHVIV